MFRNIQISKWRQFAEIDIDFDTQMTVITGSNGTGKTTLLNILSRHFGWNLSWISTRSSKQKTKSGFWSDVWSMLEKDFTPTSNAARIGSIRYANNHVCELQVPVDVNEQYNLNYSNQQQVEGLHIPSHRQPFSYHKVQNIPTNPKSSSQQFQEFQNLMLQLYQSDRTQNPGSVIKSSIISLAVFGYGNIAVAQNHDFIDIFEKLQNALRILLPTDLGFERLEIRMPDVILITKTGDFALDCVSGGVGSLIGITWQILMYSIDKNHIVVTFDEPENHLHPSMQRELLPNLERAFPNIKFIISTHSPFIVTSNPKARIYALQFKDNKVSSRALETAELSGDYNETLQGILNVPMTIPKWVEDSIKELYADVKLKGLTNETITELKKELQRLGLYSQFLKITNDLEDGSA
jgi:predicted ATP-binding protein involved in virulence